MVNTVNATIVKDTFNKKYNENDFKIFISELLPNVELGSEIEHRIQLPQAYNDFISSAKRIAKYNYISQKYNEEKVLDVLVVKLKKATSIDRARTAQRNFIARYLNGSRGYQKDAALVAFISEDENSNISPDWRFSLIQMNYVTEIIEDANGKKKRKTSVELTPAKRFSFLVGANEDTHTAQKQFCTCLEKSSKGEPITIEDLVQAFDIEKVSKEFFDKYKNLYLKLKAELQKLKDTDKEVFEDFNKHNINLDDFAKKTLGQLVFLYFIQKKGWLGVKKDENWGQGDKKFLRNLFNKKYCEYDNFFNDVLEHLFYEALATDRGVGAWFDKLNCRIPFLNGGLFEPVNGYEYERTNLTIDNNLFKEIFDTFDLYNFTVKEDEPLEKEVAIDPEMLGKVFENLLPENIRKGNGAFYTPREIVHYMCQESLINYLYNKINIKEVPLTTEEKEKQLKLLKTKKEKEQLKLTQEVLEEIISKDDINYLIKKGDSTYSNKDVNAELPESIKKNAPIIDNALNDIKVCDPAIGSGAFPVGMMNEIVRARAALNEVLNIPDRPTYALKRNAIENSIYGVDIDPGAVEIAKLRFWLSLVVDEEDIKNIRPLPNLDYKIMQGNSLITSYEGIDFDEIVANQPTEKQLDLFASKSEKITEKISQKQNEFLKTPYATKKGEIKQEIEDLIVELVKTKFEEKAEIEGKPKNFYEEKIRNFAQNKENRNFFPWKLFFADAFKEGGFDVVIGNPPYVDSETMINKGLICEREYIAQHYSSAKGNWDLFIVFCEISLIISKRNSINSFIVPNKILATKYSEEIRKIFSKKTIVEIRDYSRINVFKEADVYPIVYVLNNSSSFKRNVLMTKINENYYIAKQNIINKNIFYNDILWDKYFQDDKAVDVLIKISSKKALLERLDFQINAAATVNEAYRIKDIVKDVDNCSDNFCKLINSGTIDKYRILWGIKPTQYIKTRYVSPVVEKEAVYKINPTRFKQTISSKIVIANMTREIEAYYDEGKCLAAKSTTIICGDDDKKLKYLTGLLNSKLISWWYQINYNSLKMSGEALGFGANEVGTIPFVFAQTPELTKIINLVDNILNLNSNSDIDINKEKQNAVKEYENQIDVLVYKLYDLTYDEVLVIDKAFSLSEEQYNNYNI